MTETNRLDLHLYLHDERAGTSATQTLDQILALLRAVLARENLIMTELDDLTSQVKATDDAQQSAILLIKGIADRLAAAGTDPAKLAALTADLKTNSDALAAAVVANTPASA